MNAKEDRYVVSSFGEFHDALEDVEERYRSMGVTQDTYGMLYRGQKNAKWDLKPSLGRQLELYETQFDLLGKAELQKTEWKMLKLFRLQAAAVLGRMPEEGWETLVLAQHHGIPTRLLYWTHSALAALYFAVESPSEVDSAVWMLWLPRRYIYPHGGYYDHQPGDDEDEDPLKDNDRDPLKLKELRGYIPSHEVPRVRAQLGLCTVHPDPTESLRDHHLPSDAQLERVLIKKDARKDIKHKLARYGVSRQTLFPDLDGLAEFIRWTKIDHFYH